MLGAALLFLGMGLVTIFQPAMVEPAFDVLRLGDYRTAIGIAFVAVALWLIVRKVTQ
jgi:hypothetical protein